MTRGSAIVVLVCLGCRTAPPPAPPPPPPVVPVVTAKVEPPPPPPAPADPEWFDVPPSDSLAHFKRELIGADGGIPEADRQSFPEDYTELEGVFTFRGGPRRTGGAFGTIPHRPAKLEIAWQFRTGESDPPWLGGTGWTGQPAIVRWPAVVRHSMKKLGALRFRDDFVEVIQGSLDGNVYFLDLATGKRSRPPIKTQNPIKGSVSIDPRGYPLLFVGQGIPEKAPIGLRVYDLISHHQVFFLAGRDHDAPRGWGAFDSSGLLNRKTDTYVVGGENGLIYLMHLNTVFDPIGLTLQVAPEVTRYRYSNGTRVFGVENSLSAVKNLAFFGDNGGVIQAVDLRTFLPVWELNAGDDTDASVTVDLEDGKPVLYTGCEVDLTGPKGRTHLRRIDGLTGKQVWDTTYACLAQTGPPKKIDAGMFATNVVGHGDVADLVFFTLSRCPGPENGAVLALDKATGKEVWRVELPKYSWSSPTALHDDLGKTWLLQGGIGGVLRILDARTGAEAAHVQLQGDIEASPAVFNDRIVLGTRADRIYGVRIVGGP